jgi:hypothetical protein
MSSFRKKYQHAEAAPREEAVPVTTVPEGAAAKLPEPVTEPPPPEMPETKESPADVAAKTALKQRLREMEQAETLQQQHTVQHHQRMAAEPQPQQPPTFEETIAHLPERVQRWYRGNPEFLTDPEKAAQIQYAHHVARREVGEEGTEPYFARMEVMLGIAPRGNGQAQHRPGPIESKPTVTAPAPRHEAPPRQQQRQSAHVSAPPSREPASMSTGRPMTRRAPLTEAQREAARFSGISEQEYANKLELMERLRSAGQLDDRR